MTMPFYLIQILLLSPGDTALGDIVRRYLNGYRVSNENLDIMHAKLARDGRCYYETVRKLYLEDCVGKCFHNHAILKFDQIVLCQEDILLYLLTVCPNFNLHR